MGNGLSKFGGRVVKLQLKIAAAGTLSFVLNADGYSSNGNHDSVSQSQPALHPSGTDLFVQDPALGLRRAAVAYMEQDVSESQRYYVIVKLPLIKKSKSKMCFLC